MKILLTGRNGQLGWELERSLSAIAEVAAFDRNGADLSHPERLAALVAQVRPDVIVNAAAYTAVDRAEQEPELANTVNGEAVAALAHAASQHDALMIHFSTDYVFDGQSASPYVEADATAPINEYGRSKLAGEQAVLQSQCAGLVLRTSWVFSARGSNFLRTMLRLARERDELRVVADQFGAPTSARYLADLTAHIVAQLRAAQRAGALGAPEVLHASAAGVTSWHGFAQKIVELARARFGDEAIRARRVSPIATHEYPVAARRPSYSTLDCASLARRFHTHQPHWETLLETTFAELGA